MQKYRAKFSDLINEFSKNIIRKDRINPEEIFYIFFHTWRNNLTIDEAIQVLTGLPPFLKEVFILNWKPSQNPIENINFDYKKTLTVTFKNNFDQNVSEEELENIIGLLFKLIEKHIESTKLMSIKSYIPVVKKNLNLYSVYEAA